MRPRLLLAALPLLALSLAPVPAAADVVTTKEGLVLEGPVARLPDGGLRIATAAGETVLAPDRVASVVPGEGPRARLSTKAAALAADDADGWFKLALEADAAGLPDLARTAYETVVGLRPDHASARRALGQAQDGEAWVDEAVLHRRRGLVLYEGRWMLPAEVEVLARRTLERLAVPEDVVRTREVVKTLASADPVLEHAARLALAETPLALRLEAALQTLYDKEPRVRVASARLLGEIGDEVALTPLILSGARDLDPDVRAEAVRAAVSFGHDDLAIPFARALGSESSQLVANAAQALAAIGDVRAMPYVVKRLSSHGGSTRNVVSFLNQISYVRDYDVEIAQASNIANPDVATILEGVILDVRVVGAGYERTWVEPLLVDTASRLAGRSFDGPEDVRAWWSENGQRVPGFPEAPPGRAPRRGEGSVLGAR